MICLRPHSLLALALLPLLSGPQAASFAQPAPADPFPLRRIVIPLERLPAELQRQGVLVQMPRAEFEAKVHQAAQAQEALKQQPRLVKARYTAELNGQALTGGSGQWSVHHAGVTPGILPLTQFNLAIHKIKLGNADAVLGELDGKNLGLLVPKLSLGTSGLGAQVFYFDWSLRGQAQTGSIAFDLRIPACPVSILEIKLPADYTLVLGQNVGMVAGPFETEQASQKLWRIQATGRSQIDFVVRKNMLSDGTSSIFATLDSRQELSAGAVQADFDIQIEAVQQALTELIFDHDPALQPYDVAVRQADLKNWDVVPPAAAAKNKTAALVVRLREPKQGALQVRVRCLAARPPGQPWISPTLRLRRAIPRGESLQLVVPAGQPVDRWDSGQFRLLRTHVEKDGSQILSLVDLDPEATVPRRPRLTLAPLASELSIRQQTRWTITPAGMTLAADIAYAARRGQQYQVAVQLPPGRWRVDEVAWEPKDALRSWTTVGSQLIIDLQRALEARTPGKLTLRLRMPPDRAALGPRLLPIPELAPVAAAQRQATYAIHVDPAMQASLAKVSAPPTLPEVGLPGKEMPPSFYFTYRDQALTGLLRWQGPRAVVNARIEQQATLASAQSECEARVVVEPVLGQPDHVDLQFSAPLAQPWKVAVLAPAGRGSPDPAPAAQLERRIGAETTAALLQLGTRPGFERLLTWVHMPRGETWRLRWDEPLAQRATFVLRGPLRPVPAAHERGPALLLLPNVILPLPPSGIWVSWGGTTQRWEIPMIAAPEADHSEGEIVVQTRGLEIARSAWQARQPQLTALGAGLPTPPHGARVYRWEGASKPPALTVWTRPSAAFDDAAPLFDHAQLTTYLEAGGKTLHHFRFQALRWPKAELPVRLPRPARQVLAARLDGQWLDRLVQESAAAGIEVRLPMPLDGKAHWFEVLFASETAASAWRLAFEAPNLQPELPAAPLRQRQVWRLAAGLTPLHQERLVSLDQGMGSPAARLRCVWHGADALLEAVVPDALDDWRETQRHAVSTAETALRRTGTLGEALQRFMFDGLQEQMPLIVDRTALREARLGPQTGIAPKRTAAPSKSFWDAFGLVYVPAPGAPLLTTQRRWRDWRYGQELPERLQESLAEAVARGQDSLGHFSRADVWLRNEPAFRHEHPEGLPALTDWFAQGWTEWAPAVGQPDTASFMVVDVLAVRVLGLCLGAVFLLILSAARRRLSSANRLRLIILLLAAVLCTLVSLPITLAEFAFWPAVVLVLGLALEYPRFLASTRANATRLAPSTQRRPTPPQSPPSQRGTGGVACVLLVLLMGGWLVQAQTDSAGRGSSDPAPSVATVYYVDAGSDRALALVHPELLKRLDELRQRAAQPAQGAVLIGASYQGKAQSAASDLQVQFDLYSFSDQAMLRVPLAGVELKAGAFLDGAPVFPTAATGKAGYLVPIQGKGWHRLSLDFTVRHQTAGESRELRCTIPALTHSQVVWQAPASWVNVQAARAMGESRTTPDASKKTQELFAQYGYEGQLLLRWHPPPSPPSQGGAGGVAAGSAEPEVREHYFWDFDPRSPSLRAVLAYEAAAGNVSRIELALPEATEVRSLEVVSGAAGPALAKWRVLQSGGPRRLAVELTAPWSSPLQLRLQMAPRGSLSGDNLSLRLPTPLGAKPVEGVLAYRLEDREITDKTKSLSVSGLAPEKFKDVWARTGMRDAVAPTRAYSFSRAGVGAGLELSLQPIKPQVRLELDWQAQPSGTELRLQGAWSSSAEMAFVDLALPAGFKLFDVQGPNIHHWNQHEPEKGTGPLNAKGPVPFSGQALQVWLEKPSAKASLTLQGMLMQPFQDGRFVLPHITAPQAQVSSTTIAVRAGAGWSVAPERLLHLTALANGSELRYQAAQPAYEGVFMLRAATVAPIFQGLIAVEPRDRQVNIHAALVGWLVQGDFPTLKVHLRQWPGSAPRLETSAPVMRQQHQQTGADHVWTLQFSPGSARMVAIKVYGKVAAAGQTFVLPRIEMEGGKLVDQHLSWPADALTVREMQGLKEVKAADLDNSLKVLSILGPRRPASLWRVEHADWRCVLAAPASESARPGQVLFAQQQAVPAGTGRWLHQADWLVLARDLRDVRVLLPDEALPLAAQVDGQMARWAGSGDPRPAGAKGQVEIPLPARAGLFHLRLLWRYPESVEDGARPLLAAPTVPDLEPAPVQGIAFAPPGQAPSGRLASASGSEQTLLTALARACTQAATYWAKSESPNGRAAAQIAWHQQFQQVTRHLEYQALLQKNETALAAVTRLRKEHQAAFRPEGVAPPTAPEKTPPAWSVALQGAGVPIHWTAAPPVLRFETAAAAAPASWRSRESLVLLAIGVFLLSWLPHGLLWFVRLWPEQLAGLAALGYLCWGGSAVAVGLVIVAALGRLLSLGRWLWHLLNASPSAPPTSPASQGGTS